MQMKWLVAGMGALFAVRSVVRSLRSWDMRGKIVLITGGSRGLGLELAREFGRQGSGVAICARDEHEVEMAITHLRRDGVACVGGTCDVGDRRQMADFIEHVRRSLGEIDVLVNNAGVIEVGPVSTMTVRDFEEAMAVHFWGPLIASMAVVPHMRQRRRGRIVNIVSIGGKISVPHLLPYDASKFALTGLSEGLRAELAADGIQVTTIIPGLMRTGSPRNAVFKGQHRAEYAWFSISDSLPLLSMSSGRAARRIVDACRHGESEVVLTVPARIAMWAHGLWPGLTSDALSMINRLLPGAGGRGNVGSFGFESESWASPSFATALTEHAAFENNERRS